MTADVEKAAGQSTHDKLDPPSRHPFTTDSTADTIDLRGRQAAIRPMPDAVEVQHLARRSAPHFVASVTVPEIADGRSPAGHDTKHPVPAQPTQHSLAEVVVAAATQPRVADRHLPTSGEVSRQHPVTSGPAAPSPVQMPAVVAKPRADPSTKPQAPHDDLPDINVGMRLTEAADKPAVTAAGKLTSSEIVRHIAPQLAPATTREGRQITDIALNPAELGKVRMQMTITDGVLAMQIMAERPETADLLRRHIDQLAQEFHALGFGDVTFSFSDDRKNVPQKSTNKQAEALVGEDPRIIDSTTSYAFTKTGDGLDLRL
ncbi:MAG: flagellar hook-length control protein FliK [Loktanella sp.]|nr:flagellar hook-length control protein FliK [Loktanella sp.]